MAFDLRQALLRKGENESARLDDFEFRLRARTMARLAPWIGGGADPRALAAQVATAGDEEVLRRLLPGHPHLEKTALRRAHARARAEARAELIAELGDPAPHRLA